VNTRRAAAVLREMAALDDDSARLLQDRARLARALAEALEDPEAPAPTEPRVRRQRGRGSMILPPTRPPSEIDQKRARKALPK
jgi:hypothetical protein